MSAWLLNVSAPQFAADGTQRCGRAFGHQLAQQEVQTLGEALSSRLSESTMRGPSSAQT
jgi:hypothetical protein